MLAATMPDSTAQAASPASKHGSVCAEPFGHDKSRAAPQIPVHGLESIMRRATLRSEPVSNHLERHREFLERLGMEQADAGNVVDAELSPRDAGAAPVTVLPFERRDDED
jgi:hypothetical protein